MRKRTLIRACGSAPYIALIFGFVFVVYTHAYSYVHIPYGYVMRLARNSYLRMDVRKRKISKSKR